MSGDPSEWQCDLEHDADWHAARSRPSPAVAAALTRRYTEPELLEQATSASLWNLTIAAIEAGALVVDMHRNDPPAPPEPSRSEIHQELRRQARRVLRTAPARRNGILQAARADLAEWRQGAISAAEVDEFTDTVRGLRHER